MNFANNNLNVIDAYDKALKELYDHVGFKEDWVVCPIDNCTEMYWDTDGKSVCYAKTVDELISQDGDCYLDDVYTQRFYSKHVYEGEKYTMIFCDPHVDGMRWFRVFDNDKRILSKYNKDKITNNIDDIRLDTVVSSIVSGVMDIYTTPDLKLTFYTTTPTNINDLYGLALDGIPYFFQVESAKFAGVNDYNEPVFVIMANEIGDWKSKSVRLGVDITRFNNLRIEKITDESIINKVNQISGFE